MHLNTRLHHLSKMKNKSTIFVQKVKCSLIIFKVISRKNLTTAFVALEWIYGPHGDTEMPKME
jgi:hypothetical protein